ncbi:autophagy protein [Pichia californica]|nr:autophagy protein [[Candida] californica]
MDDTQLRPMHEDPSLIAIKPTPSMPTDIISGLNFANFNQDYSCISVGYENGFRVYNCEPFTQCYEHLDGSIGIVEMLFCSSLLAIVGTGEQASLSPRRLKIINTKRHTTICELTFPTSILSIRMNRERLIVLLEEIIYIYDITNMRLLHTIEIPSNPTGLVALSLNTENNYLAYPSPQKVSKVNNNGTNASNNGIGNNQSAIDVTGLNGQHPSASNTSHLQNALAGSHDDLVGLNDPNITQNVRNGDVIIFDCKSLQPITVIDAHKTQLAAMAFSHDGSLLATASDKGTIVRVFSVERGVKLYQFRRGTYNTKIYSLAFSPSNMFLIASSATGTVHVFRLGEEEARNTVIKSNGSSGWLNSKKNECDRNLEVTRQNELDKLMRSRQAKLELSESLDLDLENDNEPDHDLDSESAADFTRLRIHSDSEDELDSEDEGDVDADGDVDGDGDGDGENLHANAVTGEHTEDDFENVDVLRPLPSDVNNGTAVSGAVSIFSSSSGGSSGNSKTQPVVDSKRRSVARMFRRTSQSLGRKAAEKMGTYLPPRFSSILEPNRHFASFKVPTNKENMTIVGVLETSSDSPEC